MILYKPISNIFTFSDEFFFILYDFFITWMAVGCLINKFIINTIAAANDSNVNFKINHRIQNDLQWIFYVVYLSIKNTDNLCLPSPSIIFFLILVSSSFWAEFSICSYKSSNINCSVKILKIQIPLFVFDLITCTFTTRCNWKNFF